MVVNWTREALFSLDEIGEYIAQFNPERAENFCKEIQNKTEVLGKQPQGFKKGRIEGTREFVVHKNYVVVYRINETIEKIDILFVYHTSRLFPEF